MHQAQVMMAIYLAGFWDLVLRKLGIGSDKPPNLEIHIVITYPTCFVDHDGASSRMKEIIDSISFLHSDHTHAMTEHLAALTHVLAQKVRHRVWDSIMKEHSIIVVDCGGMSIDGVIYRLPDFGITVQDSHGIAESVVGGGLWAEQTIWQEVRQSLTSCLSIPPLSGHGGDGGLLFGPVVDDVMARFRQRLRSYLLSDGADSRILEVAPKLTYEFSKEAVMSAYEPVFENVANLIKSLYDKADKGSRVACIVLTGGLSQNKDVVRQIKSRVRTLGIITPHIESLEDGWMAVARGAANHGLKIQDLNRFFLIRTPSEGLVKEEEEPVGASEIHE